MTDNALKAISRTDDTLIAGNYIILFGDEQRRDLEGYGSKQINPDGSKGEFFTPDTVIESSFTKTGTLYVDFEHGQARELYGKTAPGPDDILGVVDWSTAKADERGIWVTRALDMHNEYMEFIDELIEAGVIGTSSEATPAGVRKAMNGQILHWPIEKDTLTFRPMEWRNAKENVLRAAKALGLQIPTEPEPAETEPEADPSAASVAGAVDVEQISTKTISTEVTMSEETQAQALTKEDVEAIVTSTYDKAVADSKAEFDAYFAKHEPTNKGLTVVEDEADKALRVQGFETLGHYFKAIYNAASGQVDKRLLPLRSAEDAGYFAMNGAPIKHAHKAITGASETVPVDAGLLVTTDAAGQLLSPLYNTGDLLRRVRTFNVSGTANSIELFGVNETSRATGSRYGGVRGYWLAEGDTFTRSKPAFRRIRLNLHKLGVLAYATDEVLQDTTLLESTIREAARNELIFLSENAILSGTGGGQPEGIIGHNATVSITKETGQSADTITTENLLKMWARMWGPSKARATWVVNANTAPQLAQLNLGVGTGGALVYMPPGGISQAGYGTIFGRPVVESEYSVTLGTVGDVILGDFSQYYWATKGGIQEAMSIHVSFTTDQSVFRFLYRCDGQPSWSASITPFDGSGDTLSPFVTLASRD